MCMIIPSVHKLLSVHAYVHACADVGRITGVDKEEVTATTTDLEDHPSTKRRRLE